MLKVQVGIFDGESLGGSTASGSEQAGRCRAPDAGLLDKEKGYYFNGTYYGDKDIWRSASPPDPGQQDHVHDRRLMEKKLSNLGAVTVESEYMKDNGLSSTTQSSAGICWQLPVPVVVGIGKFQLLGKFSDRTTMPRR